MMVNHLWADPIMVAQEAADIKRCSYKISFLKNLYKDHPQYFVDLKAIHEYNQWATCLVYLYSKLATSYLWKTKQIIGSWMLLMVIYSY